MFGWLSGIFGKIAIGVSSLLIGIAVSLSPSAKTELQQPLATTTVATTSEQVSTTTQPSGGKPSEQGVNNVGNESSTASTKATPSVIPPANTTTNTQASQLETTPIVQSPPSVQSTDPVITSFTVSPTTATVGDTVTFSWSAQNVVNCAVPVADPSTLGVPFTGHLPEGSLNYVVTASNSASNNTYWIVCANKDYKTVMASTVLQALAPHIVGNPYTYYDAAGNRQLQVAFVGSPAGHVYCLDGTVTGATAIVDTIVTPESNHTATAAIPSYVLGGTSLDCDFEFGSVSSDGSFVSSGSTSFSTQIP